jgi:SAM-dependent methyltransferase
MAEYRWNLADYAAGYDQAAHLIHPRYLEVQDQLLDLLAEIHQPDFLVVDLGGGSGRLAQRVLERFDKAQAIVIDQSEAFLEIAARRLSSFGGRGKTHVARLQDDWPQALNRPANAVISMSAIHHLEPSEKQALYRKICSALAPGGMLLNGDEVRPESEPDYLPELKRWAAHMHRIIDAGQIPDAMTQALLKWEDRNVHRFDVPRTSGDDIHETIAAQLDYLLQAGFAQADSPWQKEMWAVLRGVKAG